MKPKCIYHDNQLQFSHFNFSLSDILLHHSKIRGTGHINYLL